MFFLGWRMRRFRPGMGGGRAAERTTTVDMRGKTDGRGPDENERAL
jgi:hypothetical protein